MVGSTTKISGDTNISSSNNATNQATQGDEQLARANQKKFKSEIAKPKKDNSEKDKDNPDKNKFINPLISVQRQLNSTPQVSDSATIMPTTDVEKINKLAEQVRISSERVLATTDKSTVRVELKDSILAGTSFTVSTDPSGKLIVAFDTSSAASARFLEQNSETLKQTLLNQIGATAEVKITRKDEDSQHNPNSKHNQDEESQS